MQLENISVNQVKRWNQALEKFERQYKTIYHNEIYSYRRSYMDAVSLNESLGHRLWLWLNEAKRRDWSGDIPDQVVQNIPKDLLNYLEDHGTHHMSSCGYIHHSMIENEINERLWRSSRQLLQDWDSRFTQAHGVTA